MDTLMGACYFFTIGGMGWNLIRIKLQGDLEEDMKEYREYDLSHETIKIGTDRIDPDGQYIVLANHRAAVTQKKPKDESESNETTESSTEAPIAAAKPLFSYTMPCFAPYDPTRYNENLKLKSEFSMTIKEEC